MFKILFFSFALLLAFDASAVRQSASKALSYKNMSPGIPLPNTKVSAHRRGSIDQTKAIDPVIVSIKDEKIDLRSSDIGEVSLKKNDTVEITLPLGNDYHWKFSPSSSSVYLISNQIEGNSMIVKYKMLKNVASYIYFDYIKTSDNSVVESKQLTINLRD